MSEKKDIYYKATHVGEELVKIFPHSVELRYEYMITIGLWGDSMGAMKAGMNGIVGKVRDQLKTIIKLDPMYANGAGWRVLGLLHTKAPYIPFILTWPDVEEGLENLEKALEHFPDEIANHLYYAHALYANSQKDRAFSHLQKVLDAKPRSDLYLEDLGFQNEARELLAEWK